MGAVDDQIERINSLGLFGHALSDPGYLTIGIGGDRRAMEQSAARPGRWVMA
ncbi:hypothetical protein [Streptomyces clavuligerus]|uniref:hypothetical protein n=1 Tax=Streptomyces clavuligerus TaxID=1901 RepID=UPI000180041B|nr:hypothetical protein [Streptomyces clavuligerus]EDY52233.1 hypothetical protein SSCG_05227 [Streptomyces clavuligerus]